MRFPETDLSDHRSSQTSGTPLSILPDQTALLHLILQDRCSGAGKMFTHEDRRWHLRSEEPLFGTRIVENTALRQQGSRSWKRESMVEEALLELEQVAQVTAAQQQLTDYQ